MSRQKKQQEPVRYEPEPTASSEEIRELQPRPTVNVKMHQAYELNVSVELLPTRKIPPIRLAACQPRQGAERVESELLELPEDTRNWLVGVNDRVIAWLARDEANRKAFLADPLRALSDAGVEVDRTHAKAIARLRENVGTAEAVAPGLQIASVRATAKKTGRVKAVEATTSSWTPPKLEDDEDDDGCGSGDGEKGRK